MKIVALLIWYDEQPSLLRQCVASLGGFVDHLVAVDGAFALYPEATKRSRLDEQEAVMTAAHDLDIGLTLERPGEVWRGNEVEKRNRAWDLGRQIAGEDGWLFVIDADMVVSVWPNDVHGRLEAEVHDVVGVTLDMVGYAVDGVHPMFVRSLDGLRCLGAHSVWVAHYGDERIWLRGIPRLHDVVEYGDMGSEFVVLHHPGLRVEGRVRKGRVYQQTRDSMRAEYFGSVMAESTTGEIVEV